MTGYAICICCGRDAYPICDCSEPDACQNCCDSHCYSDRSAEKCKVTYDDRYDKTVVTDEDMAEVLQSLGVNPKTEEV